MFSFLAVLLFLSPSADCLEIFKSLLGSQNNVFDGNTEQINGAYHLKSIKNRSEKQAVSDYLYQLFKGLSLLEWGQNLISL